MAISISNYYSTQAFRSALIAATLALPAVLGGCAYPGMDKDYKLGNAVANNYELQVAYPENMDKNNGYIVTGTDGERALLLLQKHRNNIHTNQDVDKPIVISVGGKK